MELLIKGLLVTSVGLLELAVLSMLLLELARGFVGFTRGLGALLLLELLGPVVLLPGLLGLMRVLMVPILVFLALSAGSVVPPMALLAFMTGLFVLFESLFKLVVCFLLLCARSFFLTVCRTIINPA